MPRTEPRAYLRFVVDEWPLVEAIYERTQRGPVRSQSLRELADLSKTPHVIQRLIESGILVELPNSPAYEMGEFVQRLIAHLKREHTLGLADEIRVYLEDLKHHTSSIVEALEEPDYEKLHLHANALDTRIKTIQRHLHNNTEAVADIVTRAKTRKRYVPLRQRYAEVIETWESYIEPVREMVDPNGAFQALFEQLERELAHTIHRLTRHGRLVTERRHFEVVLYRLVQLRGDLKDHLTTSTEQLLPLVRQVRRNSALARGASIALKRLRTEGLRAVPLPEWVPVSRKTMPNAISDVETIEAFLADVGNYTPDPQRLITTSDTPPQRPTRVDPADVADSLRTVLPVPDLMHWLIETYGGIAETEDILSLYFLFGHRGRELDATPNGREWYETQTHRIHAQRLRIEQPVSAGVNDEN